MRRVIESTRRAPRALFALLLTAGLAQGCGSDPTDPDGGDPPDPPGNAAPVAAAGPDAAVSVGIAVALDGSASTDADGDAITYAWTLTGPAGSVAALDDATAEAPSFVPDVEGAYTASLTVSDGTDDSAADQATITATDNTVTQSVVAVSGGTVGSSDGAMTMTVPAGALAADTDISVTLVGASQLPAAIAGLPGEKTAYDLGPDGTTFSTPVEVGLDIPDAVTSSSGSVSMSGALLLSESVGTVGGMSDVVLAQDDADPSMATITGGLSHFSHAIFVAMSMEFRIDAPADVIVDVPFDVTFTIDITGAGLENIETATVQDASVAPVGPHEQPVPFESTMNVSGDMATITNRYVCTAEGEGRIRANMQFKATDDFASVVTVQLGKSVACADAPPPLVTTFLPNLYRARRLLPVPGSDTEITSSGLVRRVNLEMKSVVELNEAGADNPEWVFSLTDGNYLGYWTAGQMFLFEPGGDPELTRVGFFEGPRHVTAVDANTVVLASAFGDLGFVTYSPLSGAFQDAFRDLDSQTNPQQGPPPTNLQAIWASPDAETFIGAVTEGDGDAAFERTQAALIDANIQSGQISVTPLPDIIDFVIDTERRHQFDIECGSLEGGLPTELLCVFTSGFASPRGEQGTFVEQDGYIVIFVVNTSDRSSEWLYWDYGNAYVGANVFPFDGTTTGVAVANQHTGEVDVWHVQAKEVAASFSLSLEDQCEAPTDLILIGFGARGALACQGTTAPTHGILVIENLDLQTPPAS